MIYTERIETGKKRYNLWRAKLLHDPGCLVVVKFVIRYGEEVHELLARKKLAPKLRYFGPLTCGGTSVGDLWPQYQKASGPAGITISPLKMVVMDWVLDFCTRPAVERVTRRREAEARMAIFSAPSDAYDQVRKALKFLHSNGFVIGDLREPNVMFDWEGKVKFIDFDMTGRFDVHEKDAPVSDGASAGLAFKETSTSA